MRTSTVAVASALLGTGLALDPQALAAMAAIVPAPLMSSGIASSFTRNTINGGYGKTWSGGSLATRTDLPPRIPGSKSVKIRYGPYNVPNMNRKNGLGEGGSLWNYPDTGVQKPCDKCVITGFRAGLEYTDGKVANIDTQAWLHHFVLFNAGPGRVDQTCQYAWSSLPHFNVDCTPQTCERLFSSGNERTPAYMSDWAGSKPVGYHVQSADKFSLIVDLMNDSMADKTMYLTITYDYVDGWPAGMDDMRPVWFDVDQCGLSEVSPKAQSGAFTIRANSWTATLDGEVLGYAGHLHDGGQNVILSVDGAVDCTSAATYGGDPAYIAGGDMHGHGDSASVHISKMTICAGPRLTHRMMKKGQRWLLEANYDYDKNKGVKDESGWQESIMGIAIMYVRQPWTGGSSGSSWW